MASHGLSEEDYEAVADWRESDRFTPRERVAIEFAELFAEDHLALDDAFWGRLRQHWTDAEIVDLNVLVACFLGLGRMTQVLDPQQSCPLVL